ncbi:MAG: RNA polymerase sigma-70 factor [Tannerellaceae bacterium]|nr:RNA polymerase sigma-70 factor [Tannerellaceae bacterium]
MKKDSDIQFIHPQEEIFKEIFEFLYPRLMALACRFVDRYVAKDIVQDVFVNYWEKKHTIEIRSVPSYLYRSTQNGCLNYLKHQIVEQEYEAQVRIAEEKMRFMAENTDTNDLFKKVVTRDLWGVIESSVDQLPPKCAQAFRLYYIHDLSHKEIAKTMNISHRTVEGYVRQAILFLREDLKDLFLLLCMFCNI